MYNTSSGGTFVVRRTDNRIFLWTHWTSSGTKRDSQASWESLGPMIAVYAYRNPSIPILYICCAAMQSFGQGNSLQTHYHEIGQVPFSCEIPTWLPAAVLDGRYPSAKQRQSTKYTKSDFGVSSLTCSWVDAGLWRTITPSVSRWRSSMYMEVILFSYLGLLTLNYAKLLKLTLSISTYWL